MLAAHMVQRQLRSSHLFLLIDSSATSRLHVEKLEKYLAKLGIFSNGSLKSLLQKLRCGHPNFIELKYFDKIVSRFRTRV